MDYLVVHKLPCKLSKIKQYLQQTLDVHLETQCVPSPIKYICWRAIFDVKVYS